MKRIFIDVDDSAYECLLGMLNLCEKVEVVSAFGRAKRGISEGLSEKR